MAKTNLKTLAYTKLKDKIIHCEYKPGTNLNEEILIEELQIGRTPIRDALGRLEQEGLVKVRPKKGVIVTPLSIKDINMIYEIRNLYEPYILIHYGSFISENKLNEFYDIFIQKKQLLDNTNSTESYKLDSEFHNCIVSACPNTYLQHNYQLIQNQSERFRYMTGTDSIARVKETFKEHIDIIIPCLQKDWDTAAEKMIVHLKESKKASFKLIFESIDDTDIGFM